MKKLSPTIQTLCADLIQQVHSAIEKPGSVYTQTKQDRKYLFSRRLVGTVRRDTAIGPADNPEVQKRAAQVRGEQSSAKERRKIIATLRNNHVPVPTRELGNVLDVMADAGLFKDAVLVGTAAYICYSPIIGVVLPIGALMTQDADLATASLAIAADNSDDDNGSILSILKRADETFEPVPALSKAAPSSSFKSETGFFVDLLTPQRRSSDTNPMPLKNLAAGAVPLQHLDWLIADPVRAVALHGTGIPVSVPQPAKYAVHKLIVAQKRHKGEIAKRGKDLQQAEALIKALKETDRYALHDAIEDASALGVRGWNQPIQRSLKELKIELDDLI
ncbi:GSU2403 family nucleotidyltransferase fold protein [Hoeflea sp.]|uniref:GSU2403 family nucleotidyltransferase fold protein n=1 Tax=Hoeflea sp. TaxID=1940281 RepID=UPI003B01454E